jgi:hypothetical protein
MKPRPTANVSAPKKQPLSFTLKVCFFFIL